MTMLRIGHPPRGPRIRRRNLFDRVMGVAWIAIGLFAIVVYFGLDPRTHANTHQPAHIIPASHTSGAQP